MIMLCRLLLWNYTFKAGMLGVHVPFVNHMFIHVLRVHFWKYLSQKFKQVVIYSFRHGIDIVMKRMKLLYK